MGDPITPREAAQIITSAVTPLPTTTVSLGDAIGAALAEPLRSPIDLPPWDNSAMDGYAARSIDVSEGAELRIVETVPAGAFPTMSIGSATCARLFTGSPIPDGADCVVRQEDVERDGAIVRIRDTRDRGRNIRKSGDDIRKGDVVVSAGIELGAAEAGALAATAQATVTVHARPTVAVMASGDEIADLDETDQILQGRKIASSNSYALGALVRDAGAEVLELGIARDDPSDIRARLMRAREADLLVTAAGMSVGDHDHLREILQGPGAAPYFWRVRSRPGAPVGFGMLQGVPWIGLPGNPVSAMVTFELFVRPAIRKLKGLRALFRQPTSVMVGERIETPGQVQHFPRVWLEHREGTLPLAHLTGNQSSGVLSSMVKADALLIVPEERNEVRSGEVLSAILLRDGRFTASIPY